MISIFFSFHSGVRTKNSLNSTDGGGGQGRQFDSSCDWPAHPYSFSASSRCSSQRRDSRSSPMPHHTAATLLPLHSISISVHIKSTHSLSIPALFRFHFTSFGKTTYCIYPPYITALSSSLPASSPGTLTKHTPRNSEPSLKLGSGTRRFHPDRPVHSPQSFVLKSKTVFAWAGTNEHTNLPAFLQSNFTASIQLVILFFFFFIYLAVSMMVGEGNGMEKGPASPSKIMNGVGVVHAPPPA